MNAFIDACPVLQMQILIALAEILSDQLKKNRRISSGNLPKGQQLFSTKTADDLLAFLDERELGENGYFMCVVIHNIDGPGLKESETQQILARLSSCSNIRVVASIDHVNAPLCKSIFSKTIILLG